MATFHIVRWGLASSSLLIVAGMGTVAAEEIRDWPCSQPLAEHAAPEAIWGGPLPATLPDGWQGDAAVRAVVEFAANPENPPSQGARSIADFADHLGADRRERLMLVFTGLLQRFDTLRGFLIEGVRDFVLRAKILDEAVARHDSALAALPATGNAAVAEKRRGFEEARFWDARSLDDALEEAEYLCHRYAYLDEKLRQLAKIVRSEL